MPTNEADRRALAERIMALRYHQNGVAWLKVIPVADVERDVAKRVLELESDEAGEPRLKVYPSAAFGGEMGPAPEVGGVVESAKHEGIPNDVLWVFLQDHFNWWTPEDSPYSIFLQGTWRGAERADAERAVPSMMETTRDELRRDAEERAEAGRENEEGSETERDPLPFEDYEALERWFLKELWPESRCEWFTFESKSRTKVPAVIAVDDLLIGILWIQ